MSKYFAAEMHGTQQNGQKREASRRWQLSPRGDRVDLPPKRVGSVSQASYCFEEAETASKRHGAKEIIGKLCEEYRSEQVFVSLDGTRRNIEAWRHDYIRSSYL